MTYAAKVPLSRTIQFLSFCAVGILLTLLVDDINAAPPLTRGGRFALIVAIETSAGSMGILGAQHDISYAYSLANSAGVHNDNVTLLRDQAATAENIRRSLSELATRLSPADRVLIYLSGMGGKQQDLGRPNGCEEVFFAADGVAIGYGELASLTIPLAEIAEKTLVFFDTCSSGKPVVSSLASRCVPTRASNACRAGSSSNWRNFTLDIRKQGIPANNIVSIHAGSPDETVFDATTGGLFTSAFHQCTQNEAQDNDSLHSTSLGDLALCAQQALDLRLGGLHKSTHIAVHGNKNFIPFATKAISQLPISRLFDGLVSGRDARKEVILESFSLGANIQGAPISVRASSAGYLYIFAFDGDRSIRLIYPATTDRVDRLRPGERFTLPTTAAKNLLASDVEVLVILTESERDMKLLPTAPGIQFGHTPNERYALYEFVTTGIRAGDPACQATGSKRNLSLWKGCSDAYGAAKIVVTSPSKSN